MWIAGSPSDKGRWLSFETEEQATAHATRMNTVLDDFPKKWNTDYWQSKPEQWVVKEE